ncbi:MAG: hypothetical protein NZ551_04485 [Microscillaceae bacterium]|nr:hypothetical protein [Microscillaceae bacterium]MDW8460449.1 hypothetical protein [Cytophagales bacterium]
MKSASFVSLFLIFVVNVLFAQVSISEKMIELSKKERRNGFQFFISAADAEPKAVEKAIEKNLKAIKAKYKESDGIYRAEKVIIESISDKMIDLIISTQKEKNGDFYISAIVGIGYDISASSTTHPSESAKVKTLLTQIYQDIKQETIKQRLETESNTLAELERNLRKLNSNQQDLQRDIENYTKKIEEAKSNISKNEQEIKKLESKIAEQRKVVEALKAR